MKKLLSLGLCLTLVATVFSGINFAKAAEEDLDARDEYARVLAKRVGDWVYIIPRENKQNEAAIVKYYGDETEITIPETIDGKDVIGIGDMYADDYFEITLGGLQFEGLLGKEPKVEKINLSKNIREICAYRYYSGLRYEDFFYEGITVLDNITGISKGHYPSLCNKNLKEFDVSPDNPYFKASEGILFSKDGKTLIRYPAGKQAEEYKVPDAVEKIDYFAFCNSPMKKIDFSGVAEAQNYVCYLSGVEKAEGLENVESIGIGFFAESELKEFPELSSAETIKSEAFAYCNNLTEVKLTNAVDSVLGKAFYYCKNLQKLNLGKVLELEDSVFAQCRALKKVELPKTLKEIPAYAFSNCRSLEKVTGVTHLESIWNYAFYNCQKLKTFGTTTSCVDIHADYVGKSAFKNCESIKKVYFGHSGTVVEKEAFLNCISLASFQIPYYYLKSVHSSSFDNTAYVNNAEEGIVYIKKMAIKYKPFSVPKTSITLKPGTRYIAENCLYKLGGIKSVYIPKSVLKIDKNNLKSMKDLKRVYINAADLEPLGNCFERNSKTDAKYYVRASDPSLIEYLSEMKADYTTNWKPSKVKSFKAVRKSGTKAKLSWKKQAYVTGYKVYRKTAGGKWKKIATIKGSSKTTYTAKNLKKNKKYYFRVRAYKFYGSTYNGTYTKADKA